METTRQKLNVQFDTISSLSKDVRNHVDMNQAQITNQFKDVHAVQGDIKNLVDNTLSSTQKIQSIFLKWEFINCDDSIVPKEEPWMKHLVSIGLNEFDIEYYISGQLLGKTPVVKLHFALDFNFSKIACTSVRKISDQ